MNRDPCTTFSAGGVDAHGQAYLDSSPPHCVRRCTSSWPRICNQPHSCTCWGIFPRGPRWAQMTGVPPNDWTCNPPPWCTYLPSRTYTAALTGGHLGGFLWCEHSIHQRWLQQTRTCCNQPFHQTSLHCGSSLFMCSSPSIFDPVRNHRHCRYKCSVCEQAHSPASYLQCFCILLHRCLKIASSH